MTFAAAVAEGLGQRVFAVKGEPWSPEVEEAWIEETRAEYGADAAEKLDYIPVAGEGAWLTWAQIHAVEHPDAGWSELYAGGRTVIGNDIARRKHLWVAWVFEQVGDVLSTREVVELQNQSFPAQDDEIARLMRIYDSTGLAMDQTGMGEKPVEDAVRPYGSNRVEGVLMTGPRRLQLAGVLKRRVEDVIRILATAAVREDFHAVRRAAGPTGGPRLVAKGDTDGHADRFWAAAPACGAAATAPMDTGVTASRITATRTRATGSVAGGGPGPSA